MKLLIVTEISSTHAARWINQLNEVGWDIYIYQVNYPASGINPELRCGIVLYPGDTCSEVKVINTFANNSFIVKYLKKISDKKEYEIINKLSNKIIKHLHVRFLYKFIKQNKPDIVHSHGLNINWNNLLLPVYNIKKKLNKNINFPWLYSTWGTDLDFFPKLSKDNYLDIIKIMPECDYLTTECNRDLRLAYNFGFKGKHMGFFPDFGGINFKHMQEVISEPIVSKRKIILLKGRDFRGGDPIGRAMTAIKGIKNCTKFLSSYKILVYQADSYIAQEVENLKDQIDIEVIGRKSYEEILSITGQARIYISLTINDGLPSSLIEALSVGAFPIHSDIDSIREIIEDGVNGLLVPAEDVFSFQNALIKAIENDSLIDKAALINKQFVFENLSDNVIRPKTIQLYRDVFNNWNNE